MEGVAKIKASNANYARAIYCAGRAGCEDLRGMQDSPSDYLEWKAADEIERLRSKCTQKVME